MMVTIKIKVSDEDKFRILDCLNKPTHDNSQKLYSILTQLHKDGLITCRG